jgi:SET domain
MVLPILKLNSTIFLSNDLIPDHRRYTKYLLLNFFFKHSSPPQKTLPQVKYAIGRECPTCLRGVVATKNIKKGERIISVPLSLAILLPRINRRAFSAEYAHGLLLKFKTDPIFNKTHSLFWSTQPKPEEILSADTFPDHLVDDLQTPNLAYLIRSQRQVGINVYYGKTRWAKYTPIPELLTGEDAISLEYFLYISAVIGTRDFALSESSVTDNADGPAFWLIPVADMVNHEDDANSRRSDNGTHVEMYALRDIKKGDAVTNNYQTNVLDRNDMCLHIYGTIA